MLVFSQERARQQLIRGGFCIPKRNSGSVEYQHLHSDSGGLPDGRYPDVKLEYLPAGQSFGPWPNGNRRRVALDAPELPHCRYEVVNGRDLPAREHMVTVNCE